MHQTRRQISGSAHIPTQRSGEPEIPAAQGFTYPLTQQNIRTITVDGMGWIHHSDVCAVLEHTNPSMAIRLVEDEDKHKFDMRDVSAGGAALNFAEGVNTEAWFITEPGFYDLVVASKASGARAFKRWVTHEVLPAIRATGKYEVAEHRLPSSYAEALRELATIVEECEAVKTALATAEPKADAWDVLASAKGDYSVREAANILNRDPDISTGQKRLFKLLRDLGLLDAGNVPYARHAHHVCLRATKWTDRNLGFDRASDQVRVTAEGLRYLRKRLHEAVIAETGQPALFQVEAT
jgi:prophage antirepressor-like protein